MNEERIPATLPLETISRARYYDVAHMARVNIPMVMVSGITEFVT